MQDLKVDEIHIKLVILGHGGVGKTSIVNSFFDKDFPDRYVPTIGSNIGKKEYKISSKNLHVVLNIWDVGGQRSFNPLNPAFYNNVDAAFLVIDLSNPDETLKEIKNVYLPNLFKYAQESLSFVIGNKLDLIKDNKELESIIKKYFKDDIPLVLVSAKNEQNTEEVFELLAYTYLKELESQDQSQMGNVSEEFLKMIGRKESELKELYVNINSIKNIKILTERKAHVKKKVIPAYQTDEAKLKQFRVLQRKISKIDMIKNEIVEEFKKNLDVVKEMILTLKKTPIEELNETIDTTSEQLQQMREDFSLSLESLVKIDEEDSKPPKNAPKGGNPPNMKEKVKN